MSDSRCGNCGIQAGLTEEERQRLLIDQAFNYLNENLVGNGGGDAAELARIRNMLHCFVSREDYDEKRGVLREGRKWSPYLAREILSIVKKSPDKIQYFLTTIEFLGLYGKPFVPYLVSDIRSARSKHSSSDYYRALARIGNDGMHALVQMVADHGSGKRKLSFIEQIELETAFTYVGEKAIPHLKRLNPSVFGFPIDFSGFTTRIIARIRSE